MKKLILIIIALFLVQNSFCQSYQWAKSGGGNGNPYNTKEEVKKIVVDNAGNSFIISDVSKSTNLPSTILIDGVIKNIPDTYSNTDVSHGLIASFDCNGAYRWSKVITGQSWGKIVDVKLDNQGNVYFIGNMPPDSFAINNRIENDYVFPLMTSWPPPNYPDNNSYSAYIAKYTNTGTFIWIKTLEPAIRNSTSSSVTQPVTMHTLEIDNNNNLYVFASIVRSPQVISGSYVNNYGTGNQLSNHILKYDSNGNFIEGFRLNFDNTNLPANKFYRNKLTGNMYIVGLNNSSNLVYAGGILINDGFYLIAFDPMGNYQWKIENTLNDNFSIPYLTIDIDNNLYITNGMQCSGGVTPLPPQSIDSFAGFTFENDPSAKNDIEPFVIKIGPTGQGIWGSAASRAVIEDSKAVTVNGNEVAITYRFDNITWDGESQGTSPYGGSSQKYYPGIIRLNKDTGEMIAMNRISDNPAANTDDPKCMTADNLGNYYIGGELKTSMIVNGTTITNMAGNSDLFVMKYGTNNCNCQVPTCKFKATKTTTASNVVNFKYQGQNVYTSVLWNFGDGTPTSNLVNPSHTYATAGIYNVCLTATNACDSYTYCHDINTTTLLQNNYFGEANDPKISIFPNPAENEVSIKFQSKYNNAIIEIYDLTGRLVDLFTTNDTKGVWTANISNLTTGVYTVVMKEEGKITMQEKLVRK